MHVAETVVVLSDGDVGLSLPLRELDLEPPALILLIFVQLKPELSKSYLPN